MRPRAPSHRDEIMQMMMQLGQSEQNDLQNAALMQRLQQEAMMMPLQQQQLQGQVDLQGLQQQQAQLGLDYYPEMQEAQLEAERAKAMSEFGQLGYYTDQMRDPNVKAQILQRAGIQPASVQDDPLRQQLMNRLQKGQQ